MCFGSGVRPPFLDRLELEAQHRQRCAQLVRGVHHPLAARLLHAAQPLCQLVEAVCKFAQFVAAPFGEAGVEVAIGERVGAGGEAPDP
jgi:hypothetical protein